MWVIHVSEQLIFPAVFMCHDQSRMLRYELLVEAKKIRPDKASVFSAGLVHIFPLCGKHYVTVQGWHIGQDLR